MFDVISVAKLVDRAIIEQKIQNGIEYSFPIPSAISFDSPDFCKAYISNNNSHDIFLQMVRN